MKNTELNDIIVKRLFELRKIKSQIESRISRTHVTEIYTKARYYRDSEEIQKLIKINEDMFKANGGVLQ